ncbi:peptidyl-prolyl cis-trans isomerase C [Clostridium cavendishii DSM 21758]|uniref:Peptidyl-prolyl cis-trans isomerase C n=1 Tax=Clostridium cavendishii DSM 21758 TaxID=1121302 RepID=A0A1M6TR20_9CLOT|nr:peptidylprolyl isomerase [Clostridium cavendishii]SHK59421.1 peptidyl-prolyl cis-trans isomerase C [Clostridium cavendishii DSM 21758]
MDNKVLAIVGGQEITESDLQEILARYPQQQQAMLGTEDGKKQLLEQVIGFELMYKFGKENDYENLEEYKIQIEKLKKEILTQVVVNKILSKVTVLDNEVLDFYNENSQMFKEQESVVAKHILVDSEDSCNTIKEKIVNGELTFEEAATKYSSCPSKEQGGNLGSFSRGMMVPEFEKVAFELPVGKISDAVQTQFGYHLIKVEEKKEAVVKPFEEVKQMIVNQLLQQAQQQKYLEFIKELSEKYTVERK